MIPHVYIDTSVVGGLFDEEFKTDTEAFFRLVFDGKFKTVLSDLMEAELLLAPSYVVEFYNSLPESQIVKVKLSKEAIELADQYIQEKVVGGTSRADCRHIAIATISRADVLVSWNFKHIVNLKRIQGYNSINLKVGLPMLEIRSPKELLEYGK